MYDGGSFHNLESSLPCCNVTCDIIDMKSSTIVFSHSNHSLLQLNFHSHPSTFQLPQLPIGLSFNSELLYNLSYLPLSWPLANYSSSQNLIFSPDPTSQVIFWLNQLSPWSERLTLSKSFHHLDVYLFLFGAIEFSSPLAPYFDSKTSFQSPLSVEHHLH